MKLYGYYRSTSSYRVRIALALKGLAYEQVPVNLLRGEHLKQGFMSMNPQGRVPVLEFEGAVVVQSSAILEFLEERFPESPLLAADAQTRAKQRAVTSLIACDIHPLHNVAVLNRLRQQGHGESVVVEWIGHWISQGLQAVEQMIDGEGFCFGQTPSLADVFLIPQLYAAERFGVALDAFPKIRSVQGAASERPEFWIAHPDQQIDHPSKML